MSRPLDFVFEGFASPSYTQVPDEFFDVLVTQLSDAELRVLLYLMRRTFGFKREADSISLSQLVSGITTRDGQVLDRGTGLSKATVARGLKGLREKGVIESRRNRSAERGDEPTTYRLRFKQGASTPDTSTPLSHGQDRPPVAAARQAVSQPRDTQQTADRNTDFEYSKRDAFGDKTEVGQGSMLAQTVSHDDQTRSSSESQPLGAILRHRVRRDVGRDDRAAISVAMERFAEELGDQAEFKVSISRALNLYQAAGVGRDVFVDLLYQARGEVLDRRAFPGRAPVPRNRMAYFFALVEDKLGLRQEAE
ncbi:MAG: replication protein [Thermomicrobiales bacterium]